MLGSTAADAISICLFVAARVVGGVALGFSRSSSSVRQTSKRFDGRTELVVADSVSRRSPSSPPAVGPSDGVRFWSRLWLWLPARSEEVQRRRLEWRWG